MSTVHPISSGPDTRIARLVTLLVERQRLAALDQLRERLPLTDPDRHDLDSVDAACSRMTITSPDPELLTTQRRTALLKAVRTEGGRWKSGRAIRLYEHLGYGHLGKSTASRDLLALAAAGHLIHHEADGVRYFVPKEGCNGDD